MPIYTRTGDKGYTSFFNGQRISKSDSRVDVYGTIDELNSAIGMAIAELIRIKDKGLSIKSELERIQNDLLDIGSALANPASKPLNYLEKRVKEFEDFIDQMTKQMPILKNFILPGGGKTGALLHFARTVCRRAERNLVKLSENGKIDNNIIIYINRLSDLLFTMARFANFKEKKKEIIWFKK
ncbi:MAG: cob(I)yrinic acid a,c-diamide adenosyltransferase [Candidatus Levybacteria bacterium]|nr:cob(I)yrinic acid a,c-diamide adenosyltransferase [Candidatus Levybacteria bacterium]